MVEDTLGYLFTDNFKAFTNTVLSFPFLRLGSEVFFFLTYDYLLKLPSLYVLLMHRPAQNYFMRYLSYNVTKRIKK
jgi:hypothetical protein